LKVINPAKSWRKLKLGYSSTSLWTPTQNVTAGGNNQLCVTLRTVGTPEWSKIQIRPQGTSNTMNLPGAADPERELTAGAAGGGMRGEAELGWLVPPSGLAGYRLATRLLAEGVRCRVALAGFDADGRSFPAGTLFVPRRDNPETVERALAEAATEAGVEVRGVGSSRTAGGPSLGSDRFPSLAPARVGLIGGDGVSPTSFGALWHLLDRQLGLPFVRLDLGSLERVDLAGLGVVILPDGEYELADPLAESVERWVRGGGVLVAVGGAIDWLQERELTTVADWGDTGDEGDDPEAPGTTAEPPPEVVTPGAILATRLRTDHPLAAPGRDPEAGHCIKRSAGQRQQRDRQQCSLDQSAACRLPRQDPFHSR
jgi:hypothetical protein